MLTLVMQLCNHWEQNKTLSVKTPGTNLHQLKADFLFAYEIFAYEIATYQRKK